MAKYNARSGQDIWDITLQKFGDVENVFDLLDDNTAKSIDDEIISGEEFIILAENKGNLRVKQALMSRESSISNLSSSFQFVGIAFTINGNMTARTNSKSGSIMKWIIGGDTYIQNNTPAHTFSVDGSGYLTSTDGFSGIATLNLDSQNLTSVNMISVDDLAGDIRMHNNPALESLIFGTSTNVITRLWVYNTGISILDIRGLTAISGEILAFGNTSMVSALFPETYGLITKFNVSDSYITSLDLSTLYALSGDIQIHGCPDLISVTMPVSVEIITACEMYENTSMVIADLSGLSKLGGSVRFYQCSAMSSILFPTSSQATTALRVDQCNVTGTLDWSGMTGMAGDVRCGDNPLLSAINNPISSGAITKYYSYNTAIEELDLSDLTGIRSDIRIYGNSLLDTLTLPAISANVDTFQAQSCAWVTLDVSNITGLGGNLYFYSCATLTSVIFPSTTRAFSDIRGYSSNLGYIDFTPMSACTEVNNSSIRLENNNMTAAEVNQILVDFDGIATGSFTGRVINLGGTNAAPDGTSGGYDGLTAKSSLISKGFTVTTN